MTREELDLEMAFSLSTDWTGYNGAEQSLFDELMAVILYLNKNGIELSAIREMVDMKVADAFSQYPKLSEAYDKENRN